MSQVPSHNRARTADNTHACRHVHTIASQPTTTRQCRTHEQSANRPTQTAIQALRTQHFFSTAGETWLSAPTTLVRSQRLGTPHRNKLLYTFSYAYAVTATINSTDSHMGQPSHDFTDAYTDHEINRLNAARPCPHRQPIRKKPTTNQRRWSSKFYILRQPRVSRRSITYVMSGLTTYICWMGTRRDRSPSTVTALNGNFDATGQPPIRQR
jgi:hypothetical protein